jgi:2-amino-4-hydroxy-6-hydroxymethyldihydropteridine diphosphokinase
MWRYGALSDYDRVMEVYLSLGSNVGDRLENLRAAVAALCADEEIEVLRESRVYETEPVGDVDQGAFLNMAVAVETTLAPLEFLDRAQAIETRLGRVPTHRWGPRVIDIDIVLWNDMVMETERLTIPHPEFRKRAFVLAPLAEIAPNAVDPVTRKMVQTLCEQKSSGRGVQRFAPL